MQAFSSCGEQGYSACRVQASHCGGFSCRRARAPVVAVRGLSSCSMWALEHEGFSSCGARAPCLWRTGLVTPRHVRSSWTRARTRVPCIGRRILNHCAARESQDSHSEPFLWEADLSLCGDTQPCLGLGHQRAASWVALVLGLGISKKLGGVGELGPMETAVRGCAPDTVQPSTEQGSLSHGLGCTDTPGVQGRVPEYFQVTAGGGCVTSGWESITTMCLCHTHLFICKTLSHTATHFIFMTLR